MKKVFISQPMHGRTEQEVMEARDHVIQVLTNHYEGETFEVIDNYTHPDAPENAHRLWHLGRSIQQMVEADLVVFTDDWFCSKGCLVEAVITKLYDIPQMNIPGERYPDWESVSIEIGERRGIRPDFITRAIETYILRSKEELR